VNEHTVDIDYQDFHRAFSRFENGYKTGAASEYAASTIVHPVADDIGNMMRDLYRIGLLACLWLSLIAAAAAEDVPKFAQFAEKVYSGPSASVKLVTEEDRSFATRLRAAAKQPVNFAGHYILTTWGCGAECLGGAVIDARSGKVTFLPYSVCCWGEGEPFYYRRDSRLIVFSGVLNEESPKGAHFFELRDGVFLNVTSRAKDGTALSGIPKPAK
jgi:hypothetical protein